jgi:hypothetical protein
MPNAASCGGATRDVPQQILRRTQIITTFEGTSSVSCEAIIPGMLTLSPILQNIS